MVTRMPIPTITKAAQFYQEIQSIAAVVFGMVMQFVLGDAKNWRMFFLIVSSGLSIAVFLMPSVVEFLKIKTDGNFAITLYWLSSLLSVEILAIIMRVLPRGVSIRLSKFLGVQDDKLKK